MKDQNKTKTQLIAELEEMRKSVSEMERIEIEREQAEERFRILFEAAPDAYYLCDVKGKFIDGNVAAERLIGYKKDDLIGSSFLDLNLLPKSQLPKAAALLAQNILGKPTGPDVFSLIKADGSEIEVEITTRPVKIEDKILVLGIARDITQRKQAEEAQRESELLLQKSQEVAKLGSFYFDVLTGEWNSSKVMDSIFGIDDNYIKSIEGWLKVVHPEDREMMQDYLMEHVLGNKLPFNKEYRIKRIVDSVERWVHGVGELEFDELGNPIRMIGTLQDITERKQVNDLMEIERDLGIALNQATTLQEALNTCLTIALRLPGFGSGGIYVVNEHDGSLDLVVHQSLSKTFVDITSHYSKDSDNARLVMKGKPVYMGFDLLSKQLNEIEKSEGLRSVAILPMQYQDRVIGCLNVGSHALDDIPSFSRISLVTITSHIGTFIMQAKHQEALKESEKRYRHIFDTTPVSIWQEDFSLAKAALDELKSQGISDIREYLDENPEFLLKCAEQIIVNDVNNETLKLFNAQSKDEMLSSIQKVITIETLDILKEELLVLSEGGQYFAGETVNQTLDGNRIDAQLSMVFPLDDEKLDNVLVCLIDITDRKRAESALRESEERFRRLSEASFEGIVISEKGIIIDANERIAEMLGYTADELIGMKVSDFVAPESRDLVRERIMSGYKRPYEHLSLRKDKKILTVEVRGQAIPYEGRIVRVTAIRDITERKAAEEALRYSEERFRNIFENAPIGIYQTSPDGRILMANQTLVETLGYDSFEDLSQRSLESEGYYHEYSRAEYIETIERSGEINQLESAWTRKDGSVVYLRENARLVVNEEKEIKYYEGTVEDITDSVLAKKELELSEEKFSRAFHSSTALMMISSLEMGEFDEVNDTFVRATGYTREDAIGDTSVDLGFMTPGVRDQLIQDIQSKGRVKDVEVELAKKNGHKMYCLYSGEIIRIAGEEKFLSIAQDITDRVETATALHEREHYIETLHNSMQDEITVIGPDCRIMDVNNAQLSVIGLKREEVIGKYCYEILYDYEEPCPYYGKECSYEKVFKTGLPQSYLHENPNSGRGRMHIDYRMSPLTSEHGEVGAVIVVGRNVTEFFYWQEALRESEAKLQSIFRVTPVGIGLVDEHRNLLWVNATFCSILRYSELDLVGRSTRILYPTEEVFDYVGQMEYQQITEKGTSLVETQFVCKDDSVIDVLISSTATDPGDQTQGFTFIVQNITERKLAEKALRESEVKFRSVVEASPMGMHMYRLESDDTLVFDGYSPAADQILGVDNSQFIGKTIEEAFPPLAETEVPKRYRRAAANGEFWFTEQVSYEDENIASAFEVHAFQTEPNKMVAMFVDIADKKLAEEALRESEKRYRNLFDSVPVGIYRSSPGGRFLDGNPAILDILGYPDHETMLSANIKDLYLEEDTRDQELKMIEQGEIVSNYRMQLRRYDGTVIWVQDSANVVRDSSGQTIYYYGRLEDITERVLAEQEIKRLSEFNEGIVQGVAEALLLEDAHGKIIFSNPAMTALLGYQAEELHGRHWKEIVLATDVERIEKKIANRHMGENDQYETILLAADSEEIPVIVNALSLFDDDKLTGVLSAITDISENKKAAQALEQRAAQMALLNDVGSRIAAMLDLETLLEQTVTMVHSTFGYHHVAIFSLDHEKGEAVMETLAGHYVDLFPINHRIPFGQGVVGWVAQNKESYNVNDVDNDQHYINFFPDIFPTLAELTVPIISGDEILGILDVQSPQRNAFDHNDVQVIETLADQIAVAMENVRLLDQIKAGRERMAHLSHRLVEAQEGERRRIAQELHDEIGQSLTALSISLDGMKTFEMSDPMRTKVTDLIEQTQELTAQVHHLSLGLRPIILDDLGLAPALESLCRRLSLQADLDFSLECSGISSKRFSATIEINAFRIVQEALTNVVRHASVRSATVRVWVESDLLWLQIVDKGQGFDLQTVLNAKESMGVIGMTERADLAGGILTIETTLGEGVCITAKLPLEENRLERREGDRDKDPVGG